MTAALDWTMQDQEIRKAFGSRVKDLRKKKGWSQRQLATKIDVRFPQLNKYEAGLHVPPLEKLALLSEALDTTVDYLVTGDRSEERPLHNLRLLERFKALQDFEADDQEVVIKLIDAMITKHQVEGALKPLDTRRSRARAA